MNLETQNAKNLISKDEKLSNQAALEIVQFADEKTFKTLCDNSDYIFDFIINKIVKKLSNNIASNNIKASFKFSKIYCEKLKDIVLEPWFKNANEELTDEILELLDNGTQEQKIYALHYFTRINDPICLDTIYSIIESQDQDLIPYCAVALNAFCDEEYREKALNELKETDDDYKKYSLLLFLINYKKANDLKIILEDILNSPFSSNLVQEVLYVYSYQEIKEILPTNGTLLIYDELIASYPEDTSLATIYDFCLEDFIVDISKMDSSHSYRILGDLKELFNLICENDIYTFDLNKDQVGYLKEINNNLKEIEIDAYDFIEEIKKDEKPSTRALNLLIKLNQKEANKEIVELINNSTSQIIICEAAKALQSLGGIDSINKEEIENKLTSNDAKELFKSYFI